jgi:ectoine hydroxylase-related dioxygenase (phytanoyl-CoA dioxygenase family)
MTSAWIALQDTELKNGAMMTLVESHRWGVLSESASFRDPDLSALRRRFESQMAGAWVEEPCNLRAGQVSFHHSLCLHGSGPNVTKLSRKCVTIHAMPDGTAYQRHFRAGGKAVDSYHTNVRLLGPRPSEGQKFDNHYFPLFDDPTYEEEVLRSRR